MSDWRFGEEPTHNFYDLLYGDTDSDEEEESEDELELGDDEEDEAKNPEGGYSPPATPPLRCSPRMDDEWERSPEAPPYSPLSSPESRRESRPMDERATHRYDAFSRDRSRSPLSSSESGTAPAGAVILIINEDGTPLDADDGDVFLSADTHALYVSPEERDRFERNERNASGRRCGRRGVRTVRGQHARGRGYPNQGRRKTSQWVLGHPLAEIWTCDEDVPPELVSLATDVLRRRHSRLEDDARAERNAAEREDACESLNDDEFFDASNEADDLPQLQGQNLAFDWSPMDSFQGHEEDFGPERTGSVHVFNSAYDAFRSYWSDDILDLIATETNLYATKIASAAFQSEWFPTNSHEILCLFSFWMMLGIVRMPTITSCFTVDPLLKTEVFRRIFTRKRYELLNRALNFVDSDSKSFNTGDRSSDRLHRVRPIITHLNSRFQSNYVLSKDICIDESLTLWKGRLGFKQYIRHKASKFAKPPLAICGLLLFTRVNNPPQIWSSLTVY